MKPEFKSIDRSAFLVGFKKFILPSFLINIAYFICSDYLYDNLSYNAFWFVQAILVLIILSFAIKTTMLISLRYTDLLGKAISIHSLFIQSLPCFISPCYIIYVFYNCIKTDSLKGTSMSRYVLSGLIPSIVVQVIISFIVGLSVSPQRGLLNGLEPTVGYTAKVAMDISILLDDNGAVNNDKSCPVLSVCQISKFDKLYSNGGMLIMGKILHLAAFSEAVKEDLEAKRLSKVQTVHSLWAGNLHIANSKSIQSRDISFGIHYFNPTSVTVIIILDLLEVLIRTNFEEKLVLTYKNMALKTFKNIEDGKMEGDEDEIKMFYDKKKEILNQIFELDNNLLKNHSTIF